MTNRYTQISVETLIIVAIWQRPFIFQGCFNITEKSSGNIRRLLFRCECDNVSQLALLEQDFCPEDYQVTHLYEGVYRIQPALDNTAEDALYLLKYALFVTLKNMLTNSQPPRIYIDEVATVSIANYIGSTLIHDHGVLDDEHIGFAVSMDFNPSEVTGQAAVLTLLGEMPGLGVIKNQQ